MSTVTGRKPAWFAFACNSYGELTVASGAVVDFIAPAREGDVLTACCVEVSLTGRIGVYDAEVANQAGVPTGPARGDVDLIQR